MNTTTAGIQAGVTVPTIRTWCRKGIITATKQAGRWVIDTASLAHRIAIGKLKARKEAAMQPVPGTMSERGEDFVAKWPTAITRRLDLSSEWMATAMVRAGLVDKASAGRLGQAFLRREVTAEVASLTPQNAKSVIASLQTLRHELTEQAKTSCHFCGQALNTEGDCDECGHQL